MALKKGNKFRILESFKVALNDFPIPSIYPPLKIKVKVLSIDKLNFPLVDLLLCVHYYIPT